MKEFTLRVTARMRVKAQNEDQAIEKLEDSIDLTNSEYYIKSSYGVDILDEEDFEPEVDDDDDVDVDLREENENE